MQACMCPCAVVRIVRTSARPSLAPAPSYLAMCAAHATCDTAQHVCLHFRSTQRMQHRSIRYRLCSRPCAVLSHMPRECPRGASVPACLAYPGVVAVKVKPVGASGQAAGRASARSAAWAGASAAADQPPAKNARATAVGEAAGGGAAAAGGDKGDDAGEGQRGLQGRWGLSMGVALTSKAGLGWAIPGVVGGGY